MTDKPAVICVFCASSSGRDPTHLAAARALAHAMASANVSLVYGGGTAGIMGELAKTLVELKGSSSVFGVIPRALIKRVKAGEEGFDAEGAAAGGKAAETIVSAEEAERLERGGGGEREAFEVLNEGKFGKAIIVEDMHTRKRMMAQKVMEGGPGSGFVALAGGYGTIEEAMEMVTWNQLGIHARGIVLLNINGYWDGLLQWVRNAVQEQFIAEGNKDIMIDVNEVKDILPALRKYRIAEGRFKLDWSQS
ncbi:MAG: hypothetical protein Q9227_003037 [Pyrenula ochraceoflavens]